MPRNHAAMLAPAWPKPEFTDPMVTAAALLLSWMRHKFCAEQLTAAGAIAMAARFAITLRRSLDGRASARFTLMPESPDGAAATANAGAATTALITTMVIAAICLYTYMM